MEFSKNPKDLKGLKVHVERKIKANILMDFEFSQYFRSRFASASIDLTEAYRTPEQIEKVTEILMYLTHIGI